jgi:hypothetical protein
VNGKVWQKVKEDLPQQIMKQDKGLHAKADSLPMVAAERRRVNKFEQEKMRNSLV